MAAFPGLKPAKLPGSAAETGAGAAGSWSSKTEPPLGMAADGPGTAVTAVDGAGMVGAGATAETAAVVSAAVMVVAAAMVATGVAVAAAATEVVAEEEEMEAVADCLFLPFGGA